MIPRIASGRTDLVFDHIASGGGAAATDAHGVPIVRWCAHHGDVSAIRFLLQHGEALSSLGDNLDLNGAAFHAYPKLCEFLLENGADPNAVLPDTGETPLHAALSRIGQAQTQTALVLIAAGADPNRATIAGMPTDAFMRDIRTRGETPLHRAAAFGEAAAIEALLAAGGDRERKDVNGDTPLTWASWARRGSAILRLLCYGPHRIHPAATVPDSIY